MHFALYLAPFLVIAVVGAPFPGVRSDVSRVVRSPLVPKARTAANLVCSGFKSLEQAEVHAKPLNLKKSRDDADEASQYDQVEGWGVKRSDDADEASQYDEVEGWGVKRNDVGDESKA